jgi:hypothetical protein
MAWIPQSVYSKADNPEMERNKEAVEWIEEVLRDIKEQYSTCDRSDPNYIRLSQSAIGFPFPEPTCVFRAQVISMSAPLPDHLPGSGFGAVNTKIKDAIEAIEPGVHQFFPVEVTFPDGSLAEPYWYLNAVNRVNAIALEHCVQVYERFYDRDLYPGWSDFVYNRMPETIIAIHKEKVAGMALWIDYKLDQNFISEDLAKFIMDNKIRGYGLSDLNYNRAIEI